MGLLDINLYLLKKAPHTSALYTVKHLIWLVILKTPPKYLQFGIPNFAMHQHSLIPQIYWTFSDHIYHLKEDKYTHTHVIVFCINNIVDEKLLYLLYNKEIQMRVTWLDCSLVETLFLEPFDHHFSLQILSLTIDHITLILRVAILIADCTKLCILQRNV